MAWLRIDTLSDPGMALLATAIMLLALAAIAWVDFRRWEIDPWLCVTAALAAAVIIHLDDGWAVALLGAALGTGLAAAFHHLRRRSVGEGDIWLYGLCGLIVGIDGMPAWAVLNAVILLVLVTCLSRERGRSMLRCTVPAAIVLIAG